MSKIANTFAIRAALTLASLTIAVALLSPVSSARAAELQDALRSERQRPRAPMLPRSAFLQRASIVSMVLSPDGRQVAW